MPTDVEDFLLSWLDGAFMGSSPNASTVDAAAKFYAKVGFAKEYTGPVYRALTLSLQEAMPLFNNGVLLLRKSRAEAWSANPKISMGFMDPTANQVSVLLSLPSPKRGSIVVDIHRLRRLYDKLKAFDGLKDYGNISNECELILRQQCSRCDADTVEFVSFSKRSSAFTKELAGRFQSSTFNTVFRPKGRWLELVAKDIKSVTPAMLKRKPLKGRGCPTTDMKRKT